MSEFKDSKPILCLDFDGVVHQYTTPWTDAETISDPPVEGALEWMLAAQEFFTVAIYSSRSKTAAGRSAMMNWIVEQANKLWPEDKDDRAVQLLAYLAFPLTKPSAFLTIDDRAICFEGDFKQFDPLKLLEFKPWNKR